MKITISVVHNISYVDSKAILPKEKRNLIDKKIRLLTVKTVSLTTIFSIYLVRTSSDKIILIN